MDCSFRSPSPLPINSAAAAAGMSRDDSKTSEVAQAAFDKTSPGLSVVFPREVFYPTRLESWVRFNYSDEKAKFDLDERNLLETRWRWWELQLDVKVLLRTFDQTKVRVSGLSLGKDEVVGVISGNLERLFEEAKNKRAELLSVTAQILFSKLEQTVKTIASLWISAHPTEKLSSTSLTHLITLVAEQVLNQSALHYQKRLVHIQQVKAEIKEIATNVEGIIEALHQQFAAKTRVDFEFDEKDCLFEVLKKEASLASERIVNAQRAAEHLRKHSRNDLKWFIDAREYKENKALAPDKGRIESFIELSHTISPAYEGAITLLEGTLQWVNSLLKVDKLGKAERLFCELGLTNYKSSQAAKKIIKDMAIAAWIEQCYLRGLAEEYTAGCHRKTVLVNELRKLFLTPSSPLPVKISLEHIFIKTRSDEVKEDFKFIDRKPTEVRPLSPYTSDPSLLDFKAQWKGLEPKIEGIEKAEPTSAIGAWYRIYHRDIKNLPEKIEKLKECLVSFIVNENGLRSLEKMILTLNQKPSAEERERFRRSINDQFLHHSILLEAGELEMTDLESEFKLIQGNLSDSLKKMKVPLAPSEAIKAWNLQQEAEGREQALLQASNSLAELLQYIQRLGSETQERKMSSSRALESVRKMIDTGKNEEGSLFESPSLDTSLFSRQEILRDFFSSIRPGSQPYGLIVENLKTLNVERYLDLCLSLAGAESSDNCRLYESMSPIKMLFTDLEKNLEKLYSNLVHLRVDAEQVQCLNPVRSPRLESCWKGLASQFSTERIYHAIVNYRESRGELQARLKKIIPRWRERIEEKSKLYPRERDLGLRTAESVEWRLRCMKEHLAACEWQQLRLRELWRQIREETKATRISIDKLLRACEPSQASIFMPYHHEKMLPDPFNPPPLVSS